MNQIFEFLLSFFGGIWFSLPLIFYKNPLGLIALFSVFAFALYANALITWKGMK